MSVRTRGYRPLLALTILRTAAAVTVVVLATADLPAGWSRRQRIDAILVFFLLTGVSCAVRKRFCTRQGV